MFTGVISCAKTRNLDRSEAGSANCEGGENKNLACLLKRFYRRYCGFGLAIVEGAVYFGTLGSARSGMRIEAAANPIVLAWARRMSGLELEEAARKTGVKSERLFAWETGELRPTINQLRKLGDVYRRPIAIFYRNEPPPDDIFPPDFRRFDPDAGEPLTPELRLAIRVARFRRQACLELYDDLEEQPAVFPRITTSKDDAEAVARRLRETLGITSDSLSGDSRTVFNHWRNAAEQAGVLVFQAEKVDIEEMRGFSLADHPLPIVVLNIKDAYAGRTFSLLHELAHIALGKSALCLLSEYGPNTQIRRAEVFCNHVAGAALMPADSFLSQPDIPSQRVDSIDDAVIRKLAQRYGTSREAALRRLVVLGRVEPEYYRERRESFQEEYENIRKDRRRKSGFPSKATMVVAGGGRLFTKLVLTAYDSRQLTASAASELLGVRLKHLGSIRETLDKPSKEKRS